MASTQERAVLAGGCLWGMQDLIRRDPGVIATRVGYAGGDFQNAAHSNREGHVAAKIPVAPSPSQAEMIAKLNGRAPLDGQRSTRTSAITWFRVYHAQFHPKSPADPTVVLTVPICPVDPASASSFRGPRFDLPAQRQ